LFTGFPDIRRLRLIAGLLYGCAQSAPNVRTGVGDGVGNAHTINYL
jgi:hypothetical protein